MYYTERKAKNKKKRREAWEQHYLYRIGHTISYDIKMSIIFAWLASFLLTCSFHLPITPEDDSGYAIYIVTYTFATIGGVLVIIIFFLIVAILVVRHRKNKKCNPPLLSEEQKIAVMKQTGYVNPTYKFFDQTVES